MNIWKVRSGANFFAYQSYPQELVNKFPERELDEWEMYPIPLAGNNMSAYSTGGIMTVAYKDSKNLDAVKEFFRFLAREDNLKAFYAARGDLQAKPSFIDVPESPTVATASMEKNALGGDGVGMEYGILFWDNTQVGVHIQEMLIGNKSAKEVLEAIDTERKKMFDTLF